MAFCHKDTVEECLHILRPFPSKLNSYLLIFLLNQSYTKAGQTERRREKMQRGKPTATSFVCCRNDWIQRAVRCVYKQRDERKALSLSSLPANAIERAKSICFQRKESQQEETILGNKQGGKDCVCRVQRKEEEKFLPILNELSEPRLVSIKISSSVPPPTQKRASLSKMGGRYRQTR